MRDPNRIPQILKRIEAVWKKYPDLRLGQMIECIRSDLEINDLFYIEDHHLIDKFEKYWEGK